MAGPRNKFTEARRAIILEALAGGCSRWAAAHLAGVRSTTLARWLEQGATASSGSTLATFLEQVEAAEAGVIQLAANRIVQGMRDDPKWAAWYLEHRDPSFARDRAPAPAPPGNLIVRLELPGTPPALPAGNSSVVELLPPTG